MQPVGADDQARLVPFGQGEVHVGVQVGRLDLLAEAHGVQGTRSDVQEEPAEVVLARPRERHDRPEACIRNRALVAEAHRDAVLIQRGVARIVVGIERHQRAQGGALPGMRAPRLLAQDVEVGHEPHPPIAIGPGRPEERVRAEGGAVVLEARRSMSTLTRDFQSPAEESLGRRRRCRS
ncbi:MAG: hypothetical protein R2712_14085 [Vicinamibacterales bacterium]